MYRTRVGLTGVFLFDTDSEVWEKRAVGATLPLGLRLQYGFIPTGAQNVDSMANIHDICGCINSVSFSFFVFF